MFANPGSRIKGEDICKKYECLVWSLNANDPSPVVVEGLLAWGWNSKTKDLWRQRRGDSEKYKEESKGENTLSHTRQSLLDGGLGGGRMVMVQGRGRTIRGELKGQWSVKRRGILAERLPLGFACEVDCWPEASPLFFVPAFAPRHENFLECYSSL